MAGEAVVVEDVEVGFGTTSVSTYRQHRSAGVVMGSRDLPPARVAVTVMGSFGVVIDGAPTAARGWGRRHAAALVKVLALAPGHRLHREQAIDLLWPDAPPDRAAPPLHKAAHYARRAAGRADAVVLRDDLVRLFPDCEMVVDAIRFEQLAAAAIANNDPHKARQALSWYPGELLPGDRYAQWAADRRELLHLRRLDTLRVAGDWRALAELDQTDEQAHLQLMRRHLAAGQPTAAIRQYDHLQHVLKRDLSATPGPAARQARLDADHLQHRRNTPRSRTRPAMPSTQTQRNSAAHNAAAPPPTRHSTIHGCSALARLGAMTTP